MSGLVPLLILLPLVGGIVLLVTSLRGSDVIPTRRAGTLVAGLNFLIALILTVVVWSRTDSGEAANVSGSVIQAQVMYQPSWMMIQLSGGRNLQLALGADGLGVSMVLLTTFVSLAVLVSSMLAITKRYAEYAGWTLLAEAGLLLVFLSMDLLTFYIGFELALLPLLALIGGWGDKHSPAAAKRFVLYTLAGSIPMVVALVAIVAKYSSTESEPTVLFSELSQRAIAQLPGETALGQRWIFALLVLGLGIKMALLPVHTWLPTTYNASHPTTAALLAAVVLKLGLFGFLRLALPMVPAACNEYGPSVLGTLGAIAVVYGALAALAQSDLKLLLAYSSLSHVGFITIGLFALNEEGIAGAAIQMFNHGITTAAMFLLAGSIIARRGTSHLLKGAKGLASLYPRLSVLMIFFVIAGAGMPGLNNFVGETMTLTAMMKRNPYLTATAALGVILGAWYALRLVRDLLFGVLEKPKSLGEATLSGDLRTREWVPLTALALVSLCIGVVPQYAMQLVRNDAARLSNVYNLLEAKASSAPAATATLSTTHPSLVATVEKP